MKYILALVILTIAPLTIQAGSLNEINKFASDICGKVATKGRIESSEIKATIEGKISPKFLAKILGTNVTANGSLVTKNSNYDGLPYESLSIQMTDARQCRKELALMLLKQKEILSQPSSFVERYVVKQNNFHLMLMKQPDYAAYMNTFNKNPLHVKLLIDGTKVDLLEEQTVSYNSIPLVWHRIKVTAGPNKGLIGWLPQGHLTAL